MFLGSTSSRSSGASCWRRQRFLSAIATARFASCWPMMKRSSSETISRGLKEVMPMSIFEFLYGYLVIGVDADPGSNCHCAAGHFFGIHSIIADQGARRGERVAATGADTDDPVLRFEHVA